MKMTNALEQTFGHSVVAAVVIGCTVVIACTPTDREEPTQGYSAEIAALAEEAWQYNLARYQYLQVRSGELMRELSDYTPEDAAERVAFARSMLERLDRIPLDALDHEDAITAGILRWDNQMTLDLEPHYWQSFPYAPMTIGITVK